MKVSAFPSRFLLEFSKNLGVAFFFLVIKDVYFEKSGSIFLKQPQMQIGNNFIMLSNMNGNFEGRLKVSLFQNEILMSKIFQNCKNFCPKIKKVVKPKN